MGSVLVVLYEVNSDNYFTTRSWFLSILLRWNVSLRGACARRGMGEKEG